MQAMNRIVVAILVWALVGCGGGGGPQRTAVKATIHWGARSRIVSAPSSALSAAVTLQGANPAGGDFSFTVNRRAAPDAYSQTYSSPTEALTGTWPVTVRFFAQADGQGSVVGVASATARIDSADGSIGDLTTVGTVASVEVAGGQFVKVGERKDMAFTAKDASGKILALTPGSAFFSVVIGQENLRIANGQAEGLAPGAAQVMATVDGKSSVSTGVTVMSNAPGPSYTITDLGTLGGQISQAIAINNSGQIAGMSTRSDGVSAGFLWENGVMKEIGISVRDINDAGQVVGSGPNRHASMWQSGVVVDLGVLSGGSDGIAYAINNAGQIVGNANRGDGYDHAFKWEGGVMTDLGTLPGYFTSYASGINDLGAIVGGSRGTPADYMGFLLSGGQFTQIGPLSASQEIVRINNLGQVAGFSKDANNNSRAFLMQNGTRTDLGTSPGVNRSVALGINNSGKVVGVSSGAVLFDGGKVISLSTRIPPDSGWTDLSVASDINDKGQIVGIGFLHGDQRAFLLTPVP